MVSSGMLSQKIPFFIVTAVKTSNLTSFIVAAVKTSNLTPSVYVPLLMPETNLHTHTQPQAKL
jgi:hypothetical protein